jgi:hypothetical protein
MKPLWNLFLAIVGISAMDMFYFVLVKYTHTLCGTARQMLYVNSCLLLNMDRKSTYSDGQGSDCLLAKPAIVKAATGLQLRYARTGSSGP